MASIKKFIAFQVEETSPGQFNGRVIDLSQGDIPPGEVLVRVKYSSLNYKDALSASGNRGVTRSYPHIPGIDAAGIVESSDNPEFKTGDSVLITSSEMGVNRPGGFEQYVCVPAGWLVPLPPGLTLRQSMAYGTAGFTAALCVSALQQAGVDPGQGEILVTGASGGVGSIAVGILSIEKFRVVAATGKAENNRLLHALGAGEVISRVEINDPSNRALLHARWAGVVDTVGGNFLSTAIRSTRPGGVITACGNAASAELPLTVYPFILRGVSLLGIDSNRPSQEERVRLWRKLRGKWKLDILDQLVREVKLDQLDKEIMKILKGGQTGRVVVNLE